MTGLVQKFETEFSSYLIEKLGVDKQSKIVVAVSGGIDSMVLLDLLVSNAYMVAAAHCNFHLRGEESDTDERFVRNTCHSYNIKCFVKSFDTNDYAGNHSISVQMAARELRYLWFEELRDELQFDYIAIAHNLDDSVETIFINLTRGTGMRGVTGIKSKTGCIVRPLLFASRQKIMEYANTHDVRFREDSSNISNKYRRNRIRHHIIPQFIEMNPSFLETMQSNIENFIELESLLTQQMISEKTAVVQERESGEIFISIDKLKQSCIPRHLLFEIIKPYGFHSPIVSEILNTLDAQPGKMFFSVTHRLLLDREHLIVSENKTDMETEIFIGNIPDIVEKPVNMRIESFLKTDDFLFSSRESMAEVDADKLKLPLQVRKWREGDYFYPLGMKGRKKVSDFFTDQKFNRFDKENCWLLVSGNDIVWVISHRIDERYKITSSTKRICRFELL